SEPRPCASPLLNPQRPTCHARAAADGVCVWRLTGELHESAISPRFRGARGPALHEPIRSIHLTHAARMRSTPRNGEGHTMSVRPEAQRFVASGPLPGEDAPIAEIRSREKELLAIALPASSEEARLLVTCFGPDQLYGMNQTLRTLIESAPESPITAEPPEDA